MQVSGIAGNAPADLRVAVDIKHPNRGDLILRLVAPDGTAYLLEDIPNADTGDDVFASYEVNGSAEKANGSWRLRVSDTVAGNAGTIDGWSLSLASVPAAVPGTRFENTDDVPTVDNGIAESTVSITGVAGAVPAGLRVGVTLRHPQRGDLVLHLVAPDGTVYLLEDVPDGDAGDHVRTTYWVDASAETANGSWALQARDTVSGNSGGVIDAWSIQFGAE
ncbi:proprotein convertase P-domain-containing protein [Micromonospora sp. NBC_01412]|uniref:proprotein convertase P-domain-containing protein n=1 Tax=Micromonospora sp. NBC_01412 TaxID=2903590 RepID=UPI00325600DE